MGRTYIPTYGRVAPVQPGWRPSSHVLWRKASRTGKGCSGYELELCVNGADWLRIAADKLANITSIRVTLRCLFTLRGSSRASLLLDVLTFDKHSRRGRLMPLKLTCSINNYNLCMNSADGGKWIQMNLTGECRKVG